MKDSRHSTPLNPDNTNNSTCLSLIAGGRWSPEGYRDEQTMKSRTTGTPTWRRNFCPNILLTNNELNSNPTPLSLEIPRLIIQSSEPKPLDACNSISVMHFRLGRSPELFVLRISIWDRFLDQMASALSSTQVKGWLKIITWWAETYHQVGRSCLFQPNEDVEGDIDTFSKFSLTSENINKLLSNFVAHPSY